MKPLAYLTLLGLFACTPMVFAQEDAAPDTTEKAAAEEETSAEEEPQVDEKALKKAANRYWQTKMLRKKKAVSILKKVKDKKSGKKAGKQLVKLFNLDGKSKKTAPKPEDSEFMEAAEKRFSSHIEKLNESIEAEKERISELDSTAMGRPGEDSDSPMNDDLSKGIEAALN